MRFDPATTFFVYIVAILALFTLCAALADFIGWLWPEWLAEDEGEEWWDGR